MPTPTRTKAESIEQTQSLWALVAHCTDPDDHARPPAFLFDPVSLGEPDPKGFLDPRRHRTPVARRDAVAERARTCYKLASGSEVGP